MRLQEFVGICVFFLAMYRALGNDITDWAGEKQFDTNEPYRETGAAAPEKEEFEAEGFVDVRLADDLSVLERRKRAFPPHILKMIAQEGIEAVKYLLNGAKKVRTKPSDQWVYEKRGDYDTAYWDFKHVIRQDTMEAIHNAKTGTEIIAAQAGDKTIFLLTRHQLFKNNPAIDVRDLTGQKLDGTIVYVKPKKDM